LIEFVRENVEKKTGIKLEKEIKILGKIWKKKF
jgi:UDP-N-acetylenolpyruvoylglucosamine reductase